MKTPEMIMIEKRLNMIL